MSQSNRNSAVAMIFGILGFLFLLLAYFVTPATSATHPIPRLMGGLLMAAFGYFSAGQAVVNAIGSLRSFGKTSIKATLGFAMFFIVFFGWDV